MTTDNLNYEIAEAIREGNMRLEILKDESYKAAQQRMAEERAEHQRKWAPIIEAIKETIPPWAHEFLSHPMISPHVNQEHQSFTRPAVISLPDTATVFAYADSHRTRFAAERYAVSDDDETWDVIDLDGHPRNFWDLDSLTNDFYIALALAAAERQRIPKLQAEAERRNADRQKAKPEPAAKEISIAERLAAIERRQWEDAQTFGEHARRLDEIEAVIEEITDKLSILSCRIDNDGDLCARRLDALEGFQAAMAADSQNPMRPWPGASWQREQQAKKGA